MSSSCGGESCGRILGKTSATITISDLVPHVTCIVTFFFASRLGKFLQLVHMLKSVLV